MTEKTSYTVKELAEAAGISTAYVRQLLIDGRKLQGHKIGGQRGLWLIPKREAERWLSERERG